MVKKLENSDLEWRGGVPVAPAFDDVYYSLENGLEETDFVFLKGTGAPELWQQQDHFIIAETGFGTGLNFLATYKKWMESGCTGRLTFISVEAFPLSETALAKAHAQFPELDYFSSQLRAAWPPPSPGYHPRFFENGKIQLLLLFGEAAESYAQLDAQVDSWFLDGFAPAKNPDMWSDALFDQIARLSKPGARFATFTAAGFVKRGLAERGFEVQKTPGYGRKRERLVGTMGTAHKATSPGTAPEWARLTGAQTGPTTIIGAGIAGRSLASSLKRRGVECRLLSGVRPTGSEVPAAILAPGFQAGPQPTTALMTSGFSHACWLPAYENAWSDNRGVKLLATNNTERERQRRICDALGWPKSWLQPSEDSLFYPRSGSLDTAMALEAIYPADAIEGYTIDRIEKTEQGWAIHDQGSVFETQNLVIAAGTGAARLVPGGDMIGFTARAGQVETLRADHSGLPTLSASANGYVTAALNSKQTIGSTFQEVLKEPQSNPAVSEAATEEILNKINTDFGAGIDKAVLMEAWTGIRAATVDYAPVVGPVPDWEAATEQFSPLSKDRKITGLGTMPYQEGLFVLSGFGSKGFQQAPYVAEYLAAYLSGDPLPMTQAVASYLHPARVFIRNLVRSGRL